MISESSKLFRFPFYLWLVGVYPILHLYSENLELVIDQEFYISIVFMLIATTIAFALANAIIRNANKTAIILSVVSLFFSISGHVYDLVFQEMSITLWTTLVSITLLAILAILVRKDYQAIGVQVAPVFNLMLLVPTILMVAQTAARLNSISNLEISLLTASASQTMQRNDPKANDSTALPDIYYVVPDAYPSDIWLKEEMNFDNAAFTNALRERGFVIADHAQSNYGFTVFSLASTLNYRYFNSNPTALKDTNFVRLYIANSEVARLLQQMGYTYIQLLSGWLLPSPVADFNRAFTPAGPVNVVVDQAGMVRVHPKDSVEGTGQVAGLGHFYKQSFLSLYFDTTLLRVVNSNWAEIKHTDENALYSPWDPHLFLATLDELKTIATMPEATFTIAHLIKPHLPVTFNEQGEIVKTDWTPSNEEYITEFAFLNSKFLQLIDTILEESQSPPVIIFQADHGSIYGRNRTKNGRLTHFNSYAAYYLPESFSLEFPRSFTLINTFPLVFNEIFGMQIELQENRLIELITDQMPFEHVDVTEDFAHR